MLCAFEVIAMNAHTPTAAALPVQQLHEKPYDSLGAARGIGLGLLLGAAGWGLMLFMVL